MLTFSICSDSVAHHNTFVPGFYYYNQVVKQEYLAHGGRYITLGKISDVSDGEHSAIPRNSIGGIRYLYGRNIREGVIDFDPISDDSYISYDDYESFSRCHIKENDVLIAIYGTVGKSAVYRKEYVGTAGIPRHVANISLRNDAPITPEYLTAFFRSKYGKAQITSFMTGNIQQLFSLKSIREYSVPILPEEIMQKITLTEKEAVSCEIKAQAALRKAFDLFYSSMGFDPRDTASERHFSVNSEDLFASNIWSVSMYNNTYQDVEDQMLKSTGVYQLGEIADMFHGDEVGSEAYLSYEDRSESDRPFIRTSDIVNFEADLYPDYYVSAEDCALINQSVLPEDVIFTKDGKIGAVGMVVDSDNAIYASGVEILRVKKSAREQGITPQFVFAALAIPEVGLYGAKRRAVVASTIPHLREARLKEIVIPAITKDHIDEITQHVKEAFAYKNRRKQLLKSTEMVIDNYFMHKEET